MRVHPPRNSAAGKPLCYLQCLFHPAWRPSLEVAYIKPFADASYPRHTDGRVRLSASPRVRERLVAIPERRSASLVRRPEVIRRHLELFCHLFHGRPELGKKLIQRAYVFDAQYESSRGVIVATL